MRHTHTLYLSPAGPEDSQVSQSPQEDGHRDGRGGLPTVPGDPLYKTVKHSKGGAATSGVSAFKPPAQVGLEGPRPKQFAQTVGTDKISWKYWGEI